MPPEQKPRHCICQMAAPDGDGRCDECGLPVDLAADLDRIHAAVAKAPRRDVLEIMKRETP